VVAGVAATAAAMLPIGGMMEGGGGVTVAAAWGEASATAEDMLTGGAYVRPIGRVGEGSSEWQGVRNIVV
jgi:hypothetical protein